MLKIFKNSKLLSKLNNSVYFEEYYCLILMIISLALWKFAGPLGLSVIVAIAALSLFIFNDFKYIVPCVLSFIFSFNQGLEINSFPWPLIVCGFSLIIILVTYMIINGFHITKAKSCIGIAGLTISCFIPFFWNRNIIPEGANGLYFMYFAYLLYLVTYILFVACLKKESFRMVAIAFSYMAVLIACQCIWKVYDITLADPNKDPLTCWYYIGWGLCNEAGIMMISFIPFTFLLLTKSKTFGQLLLNILKLMIIPFGMLFTASRGTLIFGMLEFIILAITSIFLAKRKKTLAGIYIGVIALALIVIQFKWGVPELTHDIMYTIFDKTNPDGTVIEKILSALNPNGRVELWESTIRIWKQNDLTMYCGNGIVFKITQSVALNGQYGTTFVVAHSTLYETLAAFGMVGLVFLFIHFLEKYLSLCNKDKSVMYIIGFGYAIIDIYGMIDNTYTMWYFMVPLMIMMASLDQFRGKRIEEPISIY